MLHVGLDEVAGGEGGAEGELAREDGGGDDACERAGVLAGVGEMGPAHAEQVEHRTLRVQDGAAAEGADFDGGHGDGDLEGAAEARG
jgi:hypothetical protein